MSNSFPRRSFLKVSAIASLALVSQSFLSQSSAKADTGENKLLETYHVYAPYKLARYGGEKTITLRSGESYTAKIPSRLKENYTVKIQGKGINNAPISIVFHTLYELAYSIDSKVRDEIDKCNLRLKSSTSQKCKLVYEKIEDGEEVKPENISLLDYIVETSSLNQNIIDRYKIGSENYKVYLIENKLNSALNNIDLPEDVKTNLLATFEYVKALDPVPNFDFLDLLDIIIPDIPDLPFALKSFYSQASLISRTYTADIIIVNFIENKFSDYLPLYQKVRNGQTLSEKNKEILNLDDLTKYILDSDMPINAKAIYLVAVKELTGENFTISKKEIQPLYEEYLEVKDDAKKSWKRGVKYGQNVIPFTHTALSTLGVEAGTGVTLSSLSGAAATNATLAWLGGGSVASGGLGMLGGLAVVTGGAALIGAAGIMAMVVISDLDAEDLTNLSVAALSGTLAGGGTVGLVWLAASSMGVAGSLSGAAAISTTMAALGGLSVMTGGASLVAFAAGYVVWSFLNGNKKRDNQLLHYIESSSYALTDVTNNPIALYIENNLDPKKYYYGDEIYLAPNIKLDKLNNAISTFAKNIQLETNEKIVALIDTSIWDDTKEGIILTDKQVIYKNGWDGTQIEKYESLTESASYSVSSCLTYYDESQFAEFLLNLKEQKLALS